MANRESLFKIKPPPPPNLNKELLGVWNAWCRMGDREVVREAAVKGHHIEFAYKFLSCRNELDVHTVQERFKNEVFIWISELLARKQIFKASHLFSNINLDPIEEFMKIFYDTCNVVLRDYLGNHLLKLERLSSADVEAWKLLQIVIDKRELLDLTYNISELNINYFNQQTIDWKCKIGTQLFFKSFDRNVLPFVTAKDAWEFLLKDSNLEILRLWINIYFSHTTNFKLYTLSTENYECVSNVLLNFHITEEMIDVIPQMNVSIEFQDSLFDELSKYGVFNRDEQNSLVTILRRLTHTESIGSIYKILSCRHSTVSLQHFHSILLDYCIKNELFLLINWCDIDLSVCCHANSKYLNLLRYLKGKNRFENENEIGRLIFTVAEFLTDNLTDYFKDNPLLLLGILFFLHPECNLLELATHTVGTNFELTPQIVYISLRKLPMLHTLLEPPPVSSINFYHLLKKHSTLSMDIFKFRSENSPPPNFNSSTLQLYAYKKNTNYVFFIKLCRPSFASKLYLSNPIQSIGINRKILKLFFNDITNTELAVSCITFLEMIGENSSSLRIYVKVARLLLETNDFSPAHIQNLFMGIFHNPECVLDVLEDILMRTFSLSSNYSTVELVDEIKKHEIVVKLAELHSLKLPERFLKYCAGHNFWFPFLIFIQTYNYPLAQVQKLFREFQSVSLAQHLYHGLSNEIQIDSQKELLMRDSRNFYLSRIGVRKSVDVSSDSMYSSASSYGSTGSSSASSDFFDGEPSDFGSDILHILIKCHNSVDPPKALLQTCFVYKCPIFAVLATSYEPDSFLTHWLMWLTVSCGMDGEVSNFEVATNDPNIVSDLLTSTIKMGYCRVLRDSFHIFLPDNPLYIFVDFLNDCIDLNFNNSVAEKKLDLFFNEVKKRKINAPVVPVDYEMIYLSNKMWIEATAFNLLAVTLQYNFTSHFHQLTCMKFLHDVGISKYFSLEVPDFLKYYHILNLIFDSDCDIYFDLSLIFKSEEIGKELLSVVTKLVATRSYSHAFQIAKLQEICTDFIIIDEWYHKFKERSNYKQFWEDCNKSFDAQNLNDNAAIGFFEQCCDETDNLAEKYAILDIAHNWASMRDLDSLYNLETKMWVAYFQMETKSECKFYNMRKNCMLYGEMKQILSVLENDDVPQNLCETSIAHLNGTIEKFLNLGDFWQAFRLTKIFGYKHEDVDIIELCCNLAEGFIMPYQLTAEQRLMLVKHSNIRTLSHRRRRPLISSKGFSSLSSASHSPMGSTIASVVDHIEVAFHDTLVILETLQERLRNGNKIIENMLRTYRIAINIEKSYQDVFKCSDSTILLKDSLRDDCSNKLEVVHDVISLFCWSNDKVASFVSEQIIDAITEHIKLNSDTVILWNLTLDTDFNLILQLLVENCSTLGLKLYSYASSLHRSELKLPENIELNLIIELLIRAHDCFTADCNMEGISIILRKCQTIILLSLTLKNWKCIVRLLTGVARYTEMNYVFHILRENDQFEFLLRKGNNKDNGLKVALLRYLKNYCPEDRELYRMVALHFTLFSEIAQLWQEEARSITRNLIAISKLEMQNNGINIEAVPYVLLTNTDGTKICLNKAMINYTHAAEYHLQGEKLTKAMQAAKQAELLALQISMLKGLPVNSTAICILNIGDDQILSMISSELSFDQSLILIDSNNYKPDWATVLFEQYIMRNHTGYLDSFLQSFVLSDSLLHDISRKFLSLSKPSGSAVKNMRDIVNRCSSVRVKYRIASELGFNDLVEELLASNRLAYLKDTVWKKGYRS